MKIGIASDHAGYNLKSTIITALNSELQNQYQIVDYGCNSATISVDYPDFAKILCQKLINQEIEYGILICGSGIGISIAANRFKKIRAALCYNQEITKLARQHNDANVLCLGSRMIDAQDAMECVRTFLTTKFEGGRHLQRIEKLEE